MKLTLDAAYSTWNRLFRKGHSGLLSLPEDILVDEIFSWLSVRDIARLRRVCKSLALLTKKPVIWKRLLPFMKQIRQPLAPLPPTKMYNLSNLTGHEMETAVARAIAYDATWKGQIIKYQDTFGAYAQQQVEELAILPGGHFLVMSVRSYDGQYGLAVWSLEHRATRRPTPLLFRRTEVKAYGLTAKYMIIGTHKSLVIAFLRKRHKEAEDTRYIPETFELGGKEEQEDPYMPLKYECTVLHVSLQVLDFLNDRKIEPMTDEFEKRIMQAQKACILTDSSIWLPLARIRTGSQLGVISLDVIDGEPHVCVLKRPDKVVFQSLGPYDERSVLICGAIPDYGQTHHSVWNFRVLPDQNRVLVVRNIDQNPAVGMERDHLVIEMYRIPDAGETLEAEATSRTHLTLRAYSNVQISELQRTVSPYEDHSITPDLQRARVPPPLSIFLRTEKGMAHHSLWPKEKRIPRDRQSQSGIKQQAPTRFVYDVTRSRHIFFGDQVDNALNEDMDDQNDDMDDREEDNRRPPRKRRDDAMRFLPGARRAFVYSIPRKYLSTEAPITGCWGFQYNRKDYTYFLNGPQESMEENMFAEMEVPESPEVMEPQDGADGIICPNLNVPPAPTERKEMLGPIKLPEGLQDKLLLGVTGICFDEDTGRVVFSTKVHNKLHVVDFARTRRHDADDALHDKIMDDALEREPRKGHFEVY